MSHARTRAKESEQKRDVRGSRAGARANQEARLRRWRVLTVALLVSGYAGYYFCRSDLAVTMPLLIASMAHAGAHGGMGADTARIRLGTIASLGVFAYALGKFPSGMIADYLGGRRNFLLGMVGAIGFTVVCAASGAFPLFTLAWMGNRLAQSLGWAGAVKVTSKWFPFRQYGTVMAVISLSFLFGDAAARQFMAVLIGRGLGWRGVFGVDAAILAALFLLCVFWLRESPAAIGASEPADDPRNLFSQAEGSAVSWRALLAPLLCSPVFWIACVLSLGTTILRETFGLWTPTYFTQATGMSVARAAAASSLFPLLGGVSVMLCGWLSDRLGRSGRACIMAAGLGAAGLVLLAIAAGLPHGSQGATVVLIGLIGFLVVGPYSFLAGAIALDLGGRYAGGTASGLIDGIGYLGAVISGDTMARVSVAFGWNGAFRLLGAIAFLSALAALAFWRRQGVSAGASPTGA